MQIKRHELLMNMMPALKEVEQLEKIRRKQNSCLD